MSKSCYSPIVYFLSYIQFIFLFSGYHEYGFHLFTLNSSVFNSTVQDMSIEWVSFLFFITSITILKPCWDTWPGVEQWRNRAIKDLIYGCSLYSFICLNHVSSYKSFFSFVNTVASRMPSLQLCATIMNHLFSYTRTTTIKQLTCQTHQPGAKTSWTGFALGKLTASKVLWWLISNCYRVSFADSQGVISTLTDKTEITRKQRFV